LAGCVELLVALAPVEGATEVFTEGATDGSFTHEVEPVCLVREYTGQDMQRTDPRQPAYVFRGHGIHVVMVLQPGGVKWPTGHSAHKPGNRTESGMV
jgi:hypothetical protein